MYPNQRGGMYGSAVQQKPNNRRKKVFIALAVLVVATVLVAVISIVSSGIGSGGSGKKLISLIQKQDTPGSYALLSKSAKQLISETQWDLEVKKNAELLGNNNATLAYTDKRSDGLIEEGYDIGEPGKIIRVTTTTNSDGYIETLTVRKTLL